MLENEGKRKITLDEIIQAMKTKGEESERAKLRPFPEQFARQLQFIRNSTKRATSR